jgi:hypothetical protein
MAAYRRIGVSNNAHSPTRKEFAMPPSAPSSWPQRHWPTVAATALACSALWGAAVLAMPSLRPDAAAPASGLAACPVAERLAPLQDSPAASALDALRQAVALGNEDASAALSSTLLNHYEQHADAAALFESLLWLERDLDSPRFTAFALIDRVVHGPCLHDPALRWHWLCNRGE